MHVFIERTRETKDVPASSVQDVLGVLGIIPDEVLVVRNGKLVAEDELLCEGDVVKVLSVISGG